MAIKRIQVMGGLAVEVLSIAAYIALLYVICSLIEVIYR